MPDHRARVHAAAGEARVGRVHGGCLASPAHPRLALLLATVMLAAGLAGDIVEDAAVVRWAALLLIVVGLVAIISLLPAGVADPRDEARDHRGPVPPIGPGHL